VPVYDRTYRAFEGEARRRFRWWTVVTQELHVLLRLRPLQWLMLVPLFHVFLRFCQVAVYDAVAGNPNSPLAFAVRSASILSVNGRAFYDFLRIQSLFVFLLLLLAGSGMLCNDVRHNLLEVYFSKPLTWRDYMLGKVGTLVGLGLLLTAVPGVLLVLFHNLLAPGLETLQESWWWPLGIVGHSLAIVLPCALGTLAFSALFWSERWAALAAVALVIADWFAGYIMAEVLSNRFLLLASLPTSITRLGEAMLVRRASPLNLPWQPALVFVLAVCAVSLVVVVQTARRAEAGK
jgi:hypothetical protein